MSQEQINDPIFIQITPPKTINVTVVEQKVLPVVTVQIPGIQGPASVDRPLDVDPLETYLTARGNFPNGNYA